MTEPGLAGTFHGGQLGIQATIRKGSSVVLFMGPISDWIGLSGGIGDVGRVGRSINDDFCDIRRDISMAGGKREA